MNDALCKLRKAGLHGAPALEERPTKLFVTTTLLTGETSRFTDAYGTQVSDVDHHGLFTFTEAQLHDDAGDHALALAARCSASYPFAFEPSFVPFEKGVQNEKAKARDCWH